MVFFARNQQEAIRHSKRVAEYEGMKYVRPKLAKNQIPHTSGWQTYTNGWV